MTGEEVKEWGNKCLLWLKLADLSGDRDKCHRCGGFEDKEERQP